MSNPFKDWVGADTKTCITTDPEQVDRKSVTKVCRGDTQYAISGDEWCKSCYSVYHSLCANIALLIGSHINGNLEPDINDMRYVLINKISEDRKEFLEEKVSLPEVKEKVSEYETLLKAIMECIEKRIYQNSKCYVILHRIANSPTKTQVGDKRHDNAVFLFCLEFKRVFIFYNKLIKHHNLDPMKGFYNQKSNNYRAARAVCDNRMKSEEFLIDYINKLESSYKNAPSNKDNKEISAVEKQRILEELSSNKVSVSFYKNSSGKHKSNSYSYSRPRITYEVVPQFQTSDFYAALHNKVKRYHAKQ
jgi:hypothetical protein